jgi:hypothetical protein
MTARDMQAEQRYHRGQRRAHSRHVTGEGVVCGLDVDVEGTDDGGLVIAVDPGFALDCYGRSVVVPNRTSKELGPTEAPDGDRVSLYLDYSECVKESVPIPGSEKSCEEECAYNRVLEVFEIRCVDGGPADGTVKTIPDVDFPTRKEVADDEGESTQGPTNSELATIARSFTMDGDDAAACVTGDPTVFLGVFDHAGGNTWEWAHDVPRSRVYTNDMLYAATARHTADFLNPHQVSLSARTRAEGDAALHVEDDENPDSDVTVTSSDDTVAVDADADAKQLDLTEGQSITDLKEKTDDHIADQENPHQVSLAAKSVPGSVDGAALHVEDDESADANVTVTSSDRTVAVSADADTKQVDLTAGEALLEIIEDRLAPMEQYVMDKTLKYKLRTFSRVADTFGSEAAARVAERTRDAILERAYANRDDYFSFVEGVHELERQVLEEVEGMATEETLERYGRALERLGETIDGAGEAGVLRVAVAQDEVCEAAEWLEARNEDLRQSLEEKRDAYASVADRFESEAARMVVERTDDAIADGVHTEDEAYRRFIEDVVELEDEVAGELEGTVTRASYDRYVSGLEELFTALGAEDVRDVMPAQNRVSDAAARLERDTTEPNEELRASLLRTREAFTDVVERFESEVAREVVAMTEDGIGAEAYADGQEYVGFVEQLSGVERELTGELQDRATGASLEGYAAAVDELAAAIERRAGPGEVATAQNRVSGSARQLERRERRERRRRTLDQELQYSLQHVRESFVIVAERFGSEVAREVVAMTEDAIEGRVATADAEYVGFIEELFGAERELLGELEGTATSTSLERYDAAVSRLAAILEESRSAHDVAAVQNTVSEVAARLEQGEELPREQLHGSLQHQRDAFASVAERFESEVAREVVAMVEDAIGAGVYADEADYRAYTEDVIPVERDLLEELGGAVTQSTLERYAMAVDRLAAMVERGSNVGEVAAAQNGVSEAAAGLEPDDGVSLDEELRASLDGTREAFAGVADRFGSEVAREVVAMTEDAIGAEAYADGQEYVGFVEELSGVERELLGELQGVATQASLEEYHAATGELASALETGEPQRVAAAQDGASTAATRLARIEESTDEKFQTSLTNARTAFAGVAERFNSKVAGRVVGMVENGIRNKVYGDPDAYLRFVEELFPVERRLLEELQQVGVRDGLENYYTALKALNSALQDGDPHQVVAVQNGVSEAAAGLGGTALRWPDRTVERTGDTTVDWTGDRTGDTTGDPTFDPTFDTTRDPTFERVFDPTEYTVAELEQELATVSDPKLLESILAAEIDGQDRTTAKDAIRTRLAKVSR